MSEQYPLLCDEVSEEERLTPLFHRRLLMSKARARNHVRGAAAIITRWPGYWTTSLNYWWIGLGMLAITTYILYSCISSYAMLQPANMLRPVGDKGPKLPKSTIPPKVFMHILVDHQQEVDLTSYLPYIEQMTTKYKQFKYELIIVANDTNVETKKLNDNENNELALNMLWADNFHDKKILSNNNNLNIKYVTLTKYLYDSPLRKHSENLPHQFIKFLMRAVSIWEQGGIAFDPIVLTPQSPNTFYMDKVYNILKNYKTKKTKTHSKSLKELVSSKKTKKYKRKPNNIRDIINALENESTTEKSYNELLDEVETKDNLTVTLERKLRSVTDKKINKEDESTFMSITETENLNRTEYNDAKMHPKDTYNKEKQIVNSHKVNLLPMFLDYLFHNKQTKYPNGTTTNSEPRKADKQIKGIEKSIENRSIQMRYSLNEITEQMNYKPIIISAKGINEKSDYNSKLGNVIEKEVENLFEVTIDLKGFIIAADTACHAFIGSMFSSVINYDRNETVTDFIINELSIFCKGLFASCVGIDIIWL